MVLALSISLAINGILFVGGSLISVVTTGFEALTGISALASRNASEIADLSESLIIERQTKRELKGELVDVSGQLYNERQLTRKFKGEISDISAELISERKIKRELKTELLEVSGNLTNQRSITRNIQKNLTETAGQLTVERQGREVLKSQLGELSKSLRFEKNTSKKFQVEAAELSAELVANGAETKILTSQLSDLRGGLVPFKGKKVPLNEAIDQTADIISKRAINSSKREIASMPGEAFPWIGMAVIVGATTLELRDLCLTVKDMSELRKALSPSVQENHDELEVCSMKVPSKEEIIASLKESPKKAWEQTKGFIPSIEDVKELDLTEFAWKETYSALDDYWQKTKNNGSSTLQGLIAWWNAS